jgi:hypothetical protein
MTSSLSLNVGLRSSNVVAQQGAAVNSGRRSDHLAGDTGPASILLQSPQSKGWCCIDTESRQHQQRASKLAYLEDLAAAPLCRLGREGAPTYCRADQGSPGRQKAAGAALGNPTNLDQAGVLGRKMMTAQADQFAANVLPLVLELRASDARGYGFVASVLNARRIRTARGGRWHVSTVQNLLARSQ